ncbi:gamma-glutamyltransferase, partial [Klebsiella pneumoniae]|uniref:gamma-glutamyltransferase n=2 Tax=Pseudomonadota TaxID=1224 RepID=UPI0019541994
SMAQKEHGARPWASLFDEGVRLADDGFKVSPRLAGMIRSAAPQASAPDAVAYFTKPDGSKYAAGDTLKNPAYAATLRKIAAEGPAALLD